MLQITLIRVFDVIWSPNMAYMIITQAMLCFGFAGVFYSIWPLRDIASINGYLSKLAHLLSLATFCILPVVNSFPFNFHLFSTAPLKATISFLAIYTAIALPFFFAGLIFSAVFTIYSREIRTLYFWDLTGAAVGCFILIPILPKIGTAGLVLLACSLTLVASGLFSNNRKILIGSLVISLLVIAMPISLSPERYLEFNLHINKRSLKAFQALNQIEKTFWDPISRIDVVALHDRKFLAYDGGSQSSYIYPFDGDFSALRNSLHDQIPKHFWGNMVLASHFIKKDTNQSVLIIGSAGGQETKAALLFGAARIDAIELVNYVVQVGKNEYAEYNGGIFNHPAVNAITGEGRSYLRSTDRKYDIIQMFSNHTSSSIASGSGALSANYLQTLEAYQDYFSKLNEAGILHINHHIYPRILTTAAKAWRNMNRTDFSKHVLVFEKQGVQDNLPTVLIKMSLWKQEEIEQLQSFMGKNNKIVMNPIHSEHNFLPSSTLDNELSSSLLEKAGFVLRPATDDKPFFIFLRKKLGKLEVDSDNLTNQSTADLLNGQRSRLVPMDIIHLVMTGGTSLFFAFVFFLISFYQSKRGRSTWVMRKRSTVYFACLGSGFIILELIFIQMYMRLIGYPLYTYSTVVFSLLLSAGVGSLASKKLAINSKKRWYWPFLGIIISGTLTLLFYPLIAEQFLTAPTILRIATAMFLIFPVGFFLGMPFPLGVLTIQGHETGAVGWAWGVNGLFTVIGGVLSVVLSILLGFKLTLLVALAAYCLAFLMMFSLKDKKFDLA